MIKNFSFNKKLWLGIIVGIIAVYTLLCAMVYWLCSWQLCFEESLGTFYYNASFVADVATGPGGVARLVAIYLVQWCVTPLAASLVAGALLTLIFSLLAVAARKICGNWLYTPLMLVPVGYLAVLQTDIDYRLDGTVAFALMCAGLLAYSAASRLQWRVVTALAACVAVWWLAVQVAILLAVLIVVVELVKAPRTSYMFLICPLAVWGMCLASVTAGYFPSVAAAMDPDAYFSGWDELNGGYLPWTITVAITVAVALLSKKRSFTAKRRKIAIACSMVITLALLCYGYQLADGKQRMPFMRQSYYLAKGDMDGVVRAYMPTDTSDAAMRNMLNIALAEKGQLASVMLRYAGQDPTSLYNAATRDRYNYFVLSDVYWSMGLVGAAQRYAFEANESVGNLSPRMLKRLIDTNIVNGSYAVAEKYINLLADTRYYSDFAESRRALLYNDAAVDADPALGPKRACRIAPNRFSAYRGVGDDMLQVLRTNPSHTATMQYLGMLHLLRRNVPAFMALIDEFYGTPALPMPLPEHFQEAVAVASIIDGNDLYLKYQVHPSVLEKCQAFWQRRQPAPNTLWQYMRQARQAAEAADPTATPTSHGE